MPSLINLSATRRRTRLGLLCDIDHAAATFANLLQQLVMANHPAQRFVHRFNLDGGLADFGRRGGSASGCS